MAKPIAYERALWFSQLYIHNITLIEIAHFVLAALWGDIKNGGWHGEWSDLDMVYSILRKCASLLHRRPHNCSKMSGILRARAATESAECSALPGVASCLTTASLLDVLCYHCLNHCTATLRGECLCVASCKVETACSC